MSETLLTLAECARLPNKPRWMLQLLVWTRRFPRPDWTDAAGRNHWEKAHVLRWWRSPANIRRRARTRPGVVVGALRNQLGHQTIFAAGLMAVVGKSPVSAD